MTGRAGQRRRWSVGRAALASLAFHALVLVILGLSVAPHLAWTPPPPDVQLELAPLPPPPGAVAGPPARAAAPSTPMAAAPPTPARPAPEPPAIPALPMAAARASPTAAGGGSGAPSPAPAPLLAEPGGDLKGLLRASVGCVHRDDVGLTRAEREACDRRAGEVARGDGKRLPIPDDKLVGYARQAESDERRRAWREGPLPQPFVPCSAAQVGSNLGLGCLPKEASHTVVRF